MSYVSLHNHSEYSILNALPTVEELVLRAKDYGHKAIALSDNGTLAGAWELYKCGKQHGIKSIIGCDFYFYDDKSNINEKSRHIIFLAKNAIGYKNLLTLHREGFENNASDAKKNYSVIDWNLVEKYKDGLICLTGCGNGILSTLLMKKDFDRFNSTLDRLKNMFGDNLALEIQANNMKRNATNFGEAIDQPYINQQLIKAGKEKNIKVVATSNTHYINKDESDTHDVLMAIGSHQPIYSNFRNKYTVPDFYFKDEEAIRSFFSRNYGLDAANEFIDNTNYFADLCEIPEWINPKFSNPSGKELPEFPVKDEKEYPEFLKWLELQSDFIKSLDEDRQYLRYHVEIGLQKKVSPDKLDIYKARVEEELDVLEFQNLSSYMLIVRDYLMWCKNNGIAIGPGRGSVGGCLIAYLIDIHKADSIKYGLVFPRFQNKLKTSYADVDCDFSKEGKPLVEQYITNKYGSHNVAHISNFNTVTPKVYARDISRACELGGSKENAVQIGNSVADSIARELGDLDEVVEQSPIFNEYVKRYPELIKHKKINGLKRALSIHAAGIVIGKRKLTGLIPTRKDIDGTISVELDKEYAEECGLVKMDILGLSTLDVISLTEKLIRNNNKTVPIWDDVIETYDEKTYDLISRGDTFGVFQFGTSAGTVDLCKKIKPKNIDDLAIITTIARPASKDIRDAFIKTRDGKQDVSLLHKSLKNALQDTFGFPLYDESLLILAKDVAGWDLNEADKLRKLTKEKGKNPEKVKGWKNDFINGSIKNGLNEKIVELIWEKIIEPFGRYSFNKSIFENEKITTYTKEGNYLSDKDIKNIEVGDYVKSRDECTKEDIFVEVNGKYDHGILDLVEVELITGEKIKCTMNHKFRVKENGEMLPLWEILEKGLSITVDTAL